MKTKRVSAIVFGLIVLFLGIGMAGSVIPAFTKPADRGYTWLLGFHDDYIGYASYIKEGMYGESAFRVRSLPKPQPATSAQLIYILIGRLAGPTGIDAPVAYHISRGFLGLLFLASIYAFLRTVIPDARVVLAVFLLCGFSSTVGWYLYDPETRQFVYSAITSWGFINNTALRFASRHHYMASAALFMVNSALPFVGWGRRMPGVFLGFISAFVMATMHPAFAIMNALIAGVMIIYRFMRTKRLAVLRSPYASICVGVVVGLLLSVAATDQYPYTWILAFEDYVANERLSLATIWSDILSFGPTLWIGFPGLAFAVFAKKQREADVYMLIWLIIQLTLFFFLYRFLGTERVRYIQSLYFIPMAYGTVRMVEILAKRFTAALFPVGIGILVLLSLPAFIHDTRESIYSVTNYRAYDPFVFPANSLMEGYRWLDVNTPKESVVVAGYEAASNIILYSHNYVIGNPQGWPGERKVRMEKTRDSFFAGMMDTKTVREYLVSNDILYVFDDYQTPSGFLKDPFYVQVFVRDDVSIYKVKL